MKWTVVLQLGERKFQVDVEANDSNQAKLKAISKIKILKCEQIIEKKK
jgi:hypothetical protein